MREKSRRQEQDVSSSTSRPHPSCVPLKSEVNEEQEQRCETRDSDCMSKREGALIPAERNLFCFLVVLLLFVHIVSKFKLIHMQFDSETH